MPSQKDGLSSGLVTTDYEQADALLGNELQVNALVAFRVSWRHHMFLPNNSMST